MILISCTGKPTTEVTPTDATTQTYCFKDSCKHLTLSISLDLPTGTDSASLLIRDSLVADFIRSVSNPGYSGEDDKPIPPCDYDGNDPQKLVDYYGHAAYERLLKMAMADYNERMGYLAEDTTMTEEEREQVMNDFPMWAFDLVIKRTTDAPAFAVYDSHAYCYYGGAHGGIVGTGAITFDKATGRKIDRFFRDNATASMQALIRKGLVQYYSECGDTIADTQLSERLQIESPIIPLPESMPYPNVTADSLVFTYGQYEIACYADGMPSFKLPVQDLMPYLTPEAKVLFEKCSHGERN